MAPSEPLLIDLLFTSYSGETVVLDFVPGVDCPAEFGEFLPAGQPFGLPFRFAGLGRVSEDVGRLDAWSAGSALLEARTDHHADGRRILVLSHDGAEVRLDYLC
jgi:hypothetical protein